MKTEIIYEDSDLMVIYKHAGIATESAKVTQTDVFSELKSHLKGGFVGLIHRLDQPVEGLLVVAKNKQTASQLNHQLMEGKLKKSYLAMVLVENILGTDRENKNSQVSIEQTVSLTDYLYKNPKTQMAEVVSKANENAQVAKLTYTCKSICGNEKYDFLNETEKLACMNIEIETGRFHQIRSQMSNARMPLLGDLKYASARAKEISMQNMIRFVALCANSIRFVHPKTKKEMNFQIEPRNKAFFL